MKLNTKQMTFSALERFVSAVDCVMTADDLDARQRRDLIAYWAYQYALPDMPRKLEAAILRCQMAADDPSFYISTTCRINAVSGEPVAFNPG